MNSNNKFGKCHNCPAIMSDSRLFTNWETSKTYNFKLRTKLNTDTSTKYKQMLIANPEHITDQFYKESNKCNNNDTFYKDTSLYHREFTDKILNEMNKDYTVRPFYSFEYANT